MDTASPGAPSPSTRVTPEEPEGAGTSHARLPAGAKSIFRLLEAVFEAADDRFGGRRLLTVCTTEFLAGFGKTLGLSGALLYSERQRRFHLFGTIAPGMPSPPSVLPGELPLRSAALALPHVELVIAEPRARHLLVLLLKPDADADRARSVGQILRAALSARILQNRWGNALREAAEIQRGLLPARAPRFPGFQLAARSQPAEEVGGDVFDYLPLDDRSLGFMVADASGHGLPAALVARDMMVGLRMGVKTQRKVTRVLQDLNRVVHEGGLSSSFISAFYGELTSDGALLYANAGHPPPLVLAGSEVVELAAGDSVLGPSSDTRFHRHFCCLDPGDVLVAFTDGFLERRAPDGAWFGVEGVRRVLESARAHPAEDVLDRLFDEATRFGAGHPWEDDATALVVRRV